MWNHTMHIPKNIQKTIRISAEGAWAGASWDGILNVGMFIFNKRRKDRNADYFVIRDYNHEWKTIANKEIDIIYKNLSKFSWFKECQHIGSTSITGMSAKPIIDIILGIDGNISFSDVIQELILIGYKRWNQRFFFKDENKSYEISVCIVEYKSPYWNSRILFRDYFLENPQEINNYAALKKNLMNRGLSFDEYVKEKQKYIYKIMIKQGLTIEDMIIANVIDVNPDDVSIPVPNNLHFKIKFNHGGVS